MGVRGPVVPGREGGCCQELTRTAVARIRAEVGGTYAPVPTGEHFADVEGQYAALLDGLAARRHPSAADAERARELGARRARQGLPLESVISAYHIGYRELWNALLERAELEDPELAVRLLRLVNLVWTWVQRASAAAADGFAEVTLARQAATTELAHRFLEALYTGESAGEEVALAARALGFDPAADFRAVCADVADTDGADLERVRTALRRTGSTAAAVRGDVLVLVAQGVDDALRPERVADLLGRGPVGIGLSRRGLPGAAASIVDAERSLAVARRTGEPAAFGDHWMLATLLPHHHELEAVLDTDADERHPHLRDAVTAYADHGFSTTAAATALHLHPNTVKYRLDRWQLLTGWDPRTFDGLARSLTAIGLRPPDARRHP